MKEFLEDHWLTLIAFIALTITMFFYEPISDKLAGWDTKAKADYERQLDLNRKYIDLAEFLKRNQRHQ